MDDPEFREGYDFIRRQVLDGWLPEDIDAPFLHGMALYLHERATERERNDAEDDATISEARPAYPARGEGVGIMPFLTRQEESTMWAIYSQHTYHKRRHYLDALWPDELAARVAAEQFTRVIDGRSPFTYHVEWVGH